MAFDGETWPRLQFEQNPLKVVVAQVRFPQAHALTTPVVVASLQGAFRDRYPRALPALQELTFGVGPGGPLPSQVSTAAVRFADETERRVVAIGPQMASFETTNYVGWEDFSAALRDLLVVVSGHAELESVERFGLRYVDEISLAGLIAIEDWAGILPDSVVGHPDSMLRDARVTTTHQRASIQIDDDVVNWRQGYERQPDGAPVASVYRLDTDIYTEVPRAWSPDDIMERAERYHGWMTNIFGRSLSSAALEALGGSAK